MGRPLVIAVSVVCCALGGLAIGGPPSWRGPAYAGNVALAVVCYLLAGRDLKRRGWSLGWLFAGAYVLPLVGLLVYVGLSDRPVQEPAQT